MKCQNCGTENREGINFCENCGTKIVAFSSAENYSNSTTIQRRINKKTIIIACLSLAAIIVLSSIIFATTATIRSISNKSNYILPETKFGRFHDEDSIYQIIADGKIVAEFDDYKGGAYTLDGNILFFINDENQLVSVSKDGNKVIADDAQDIVGRSNDGKYVYYCDSDGIFYQYNSDTEKRVSIEIDEYDSSSLALVSVSSNGEYATFVTYDSEDNEYYSWIYHNGKVTELEHKNIIPFTISDNGKSMYGVSIDNAAYEISFYAIKNGEKNKLAVCDEDTLENFDFSLQINYDGTQLLFSYGGNTYISIDYEDKEKICSASVGALSPNYYYDSTVIRTGYYAIKDFRGCFLAGGGSIVYFDKDGGHTITKNASCVKINNSGDTIYYVNESGALYRVKKNDIENKEKITTNMMSKASSSDFVFSDNGKYVYYINEDNELFAFERKKETKIADDVYDIRWSESLGLYFITDYSNQKGELYYYNGSKKQKVASDVSSLQTDGDTIWFSDNYDKENYTRDYHIIKSGTKYESFAEKISYIDLYLY